MKCELGVDYQFIDENVEILTGDCVGAIYAYEDVKSSPSGVDVVLDFEVKILNNKDCNKEKLEEFAGAVLLNMIELALKQEAGLDLKGNV